ncbi:MAG: LysR substrate-binding domain-containing protein [Verrucomicrobiota bacterium]
MELRHLRYFVMAAEEGNISRAAARLNVSQPAVSRQIKDLEEELSVILFERESNGLSLTDAGEAALAHSREVLRQAAAMTEAMSALARRGEAVSLKVGFLPTALPGFLAEAMRQFNRTDQNVCVQIYEMTPTEQEDALRDGKIDLALIGEARASVQRDFYVETIRKTEMAVVVPDDHRLARRKSVELAELGDDSFLSLHEKHFPGRPQLMADMFAKAGIHPEVTIRANGLSELLGLVGGGVGVAMAPADLEQLPHSGVVFIKLKKPKLTLSYAAAWRREGDEVPAVEALVDLMRKE